MILEAFSKLNVSLILGFYDHISQIFLSQTAIAQQCIAIRSVGTKFKVCTLLASRCVHGGAQLFPSEKGGVVLFLRLLLWLGKLLDLFICTPLEDVLHAVMSSHALPCDGQVQN